MRNIISTRKGLRLNANKVEEDIALSFKLFAKWLRKYYDFPIRVPVYLSTREHVVGRDGQSCASIFFAPFDYKVEPYIRIATGDYLDMVEENGKNDALFSLLHSLALGVVNYHKWLEDNETFDCYDPDCDATKLMKKYVEEVRVPIPE